RQLVPTVDRLQAELGAVPFGESKVRKLRRLQPLREVGGDAAPQRYSAEANVDLAHLGRLAIELDRRLGRALHALCLADPQVLDRDRRIVEVGRDLDGPVSHWSRYYLDRAREELRGVEAHLLEVVGAERCAQQHVGRRGVLLQL